MPAVLITVIVQLSEQFPLRFVHSDFDQFLPEQRDDDQDQTNDRQQGR